MFGASRLTRAARELGERLIHPIDAAADAILDVRDAAAFAAGHLPHSGHLPESEWEARQSELPPRESRVQVVAESAARARAAAAHLTTLGYAAARALECDVTSLPEARDQSAAWPLWRPTPYLAWALERFGTQVKEGPAADLASGSGRDAVFLALRGFEVEAWDRAPESLARAAELARGSGVSLTTVECDLERNQPALPLARYALLTCFRFLDRRVLPRMAAALAPAGLLIYETYRIGQERFGKPKRAQFLLEPGELRDAFTSLEILHHDECSPAAGPITARLVARRA